MSFVKKYLFFFLIVSLGMYLRFYNIEQNFAYGWDQARDAFQVRDLLQGKLLLEGPRTGVGHFHLGPLWFYLLAPFFFLTNLDPIASQYLNILLSILTFVTIFFITRRLFSLNLAILVVGIYSINVYAIVLNRIPWNVSLMPTLSFLIYYFTFKTFKEKDYKSAGILMTLCGIAFHAHFSAIIFPVAIVILWVVNHDKKKHLLLLLKSLPFYLIWFMPTIISILSTNHSDYFKMRDFIKDYFVGFHFRFIAYRLPQNFIQFRLLLSLPLVISFLIPCIVIARFFITKSIVEKLHIKIMFAWMASYIIIFGVYGGQISEYYFLFTMPIVYYCLVLLVQWVFTFKNKKIAFFVLISFMGYYIYRNTNSFKLHTQPGLAAQKQYVLNQIKQKQVIPYKEGEISSYLYLIYKHK